MKLSEHEASILERHSDWCSTEAVRGAVRKLQRAGLLKWSDRDGIEVYRITNAGRAALAAHKSGGEK